MCQRETAFFFAARISWKNNTTILCRMSHVTKHIYIFLLFSVVNIKTVFKLVAGGLTAVSAMEVLSRWSSFDQLVAAVRTCVLPAGTRLVQITDGCVRLTVQAESLSALKLLWNLYQDGTLQKNLHDFFVTDELRELADGEDMEVNVTIDEDEYQKACVELIQGTQGDPALLCLTQF